MGLESSIFKLRPFSCASGVDDLFSFAYSSIAERNAAEAMLRPITDYQRAHERSLEAPDGEAFSIDGQCAMCGRFGPMITSYMYCSEEADGHRTPNWREHLACQCGFPNRVRASMHFMIATAQVNPFASVYVTERVTPLYAWLDQRFPTLQGSEFLGSNVEPGAVVNGIRHEDVCRLSFADNSFDLVMSFDVLEHVFDMEAAIRQLARVLKPGGKLIFQAPTMSDVQDTLVRARIGADGQIEHILPPELHGNPVDPENGTLCFRYLGVDTLDKLRAAGFSTAKLIQYWSRHYCYLGAAQVLFYAEK